MSGDVPVLGRATAAWTPDEEAYARRLLRGGKSVEEVAQALGRTPWGVRRRIARLLPERAGAIGRPRKYAACQTDPRRQGLRPTPGCRCLACGQKRAIIARRARRREARP